MSLTYQLGGDYVSPALPYYSVLLNRTPSLDLTSFEGVVIVWNTFAGPSTCKKVFKTEKKTEANTNQPSMRKDFVRNKNSTMAIKVNFPLDTVRICRTVGVGNFEILK